MREAFVPRGPECVRLHPLGSWYRFVVTVMLLAGVFLSIARGSAGASPRSFSATEPTLCAAVTNLDRLMVSRTNAYPQNHFRFSFPSEVIVSKVALVRAVARALCAVPTMPSGVFHCPADFGITYHLTFAASNQTFPTVSVDATGCEKVRGLGHVRWVAKSPEFWRILGHSMGLAKPDRYTFTGSASKE